MNLIFHVRKLLRKATGFIDQKLYPNKDFIVISNNCWGAEIYKRLGLKYNTPFVGLFLFGPDYLKLLKNLDYYLNCPLSFAEQSKYTKHDITYPIGLLDDIEVHFQHYDSKQEAKEKWVRRCQRLQQNKEKDNLFIKICDREKTDLSIIKEFHRLPFNHKISFGIEPIPIEGHIQIKQSENDKNVPDGVKLYKLSYKYLDVLEWVNSGRISVNIYSKMKVFFKSV